MATAGHVAKALRDIGAERGLNDWPDVVVDEDGVGGGVLDRLLELDMPAAGLKGGTAPIDKERFVNKRAEWFWTLRERFENGEIDIDPDDDRLAAQLGAIKWKLTSRGQIQIESKDEMRKRGLPSPDRADALAYAFAYVDTPAVDVESHQGDSITGDLMQKAW
jgi:hypothetical protein